METRSMCNELGGNYEWCKKKNSDLYKQMQKVCCLPTNK